MTMCSIYCSQTGILLSRVLLAGVLLFALAGNTVADEPAKLNYADVSVTNLEAVTIGEIDKWKDVPPLFEGSKVYEKVVGNKSAQLRCEIKSDGLVLLLVSFAYDGNNKDNWRANAWTEQRLLDEGWEPIAKMGRLYEVDKVDPHVVFRKSVKKGEVIEIRCRKYNAPIVIVPPAENLSKIAALGRSVSYAEVARVGNAAVKTVQDHSPTSGPLVGLRVYLCIEDKRQRVAAMQPIYRTKEGNLLGEPLGTPHGNSIDVLAKEGYVVSAMETSSDLAIRGLRMLFSKLGDDGAMTGDIYESRWIGDETGTDQLATPSSDQPFVGMSVELQPFPRKLSLLHTQDIVEQPVAPAAPK